MQRHRPALRVILLLVGGILLSETLPFSGGMLWIALAAVFVVQLILVAVAPRSGWTHGVTHASLLLLSFTWTTFRTEELNRARFEPDHPDTRFRIEAFLEELPVKQGNSCKLVMRADTVTIDGKQRPGGRFFGFLPWKKSEGVNALGVGAVLTVYGILQKFPRPRNPGEFDYGRFLSLHEVHGIVRVDSAAVQARSKAGLSVRAWFASLRAHFGAILSKHHGAEAAGFLQGVLFGDRKDIPLELKESFMNTGTIHILAVSGSNVATIALMLYLILGLFRLPKRMVVACTVAGLLFYMMLTGAESSIIRATIMGCVIVIGTAMERRTDIYNSIGIAAVIVLLIDPLQLYDVGFQLSFAAVLSIVMLYPVLDTAIRRIPETLEELKLLEPVWKVFAVSLAAQLGTLPFTAYYFERISVISLIANIVVVPLVGINLILGCLTLAADFVSEWFAASYADLNEFLVNVLLGFVRYAAEFPFAAVETYGFGLLSAFLYYAVLVGMVNIQNSRIVKLCILLAMVMLNIVVYRHLLFAHERTHITMLDVGQGDAVLVRFSNGSSVLIDGGPKAFGYDAGKKVVVPFLARKGIGKLDAVVVSHPHSDHLGGLQAVLESVEVGVLYEADTVTASRVHASLRQTARSRSVPVRVVGAGTDLSPDPNARLYVIHPISGRDGFENLNNMSLVLKLLYGRATAILTGDAEREAEKEMAKRYGMFLKSDILKAGHHGSSTSSSHNFLHGITPKIALISVGERNKFSHPSPHVVTNLASRGVDVLRTDLEGALILETDGREWKRIEWR